jgi:hypothetical protein
VSGFSVSAWFSNEPTDLSSVQALGWQPATQGYERDTGRWFGVIEPPRRVVAEDLPPGVVEILPDVEYVVPIWCEGGGPSALAFLTKAAALLAKEGQGVISDGTFVWRPRGRRVPLGIPPDRAQFHGKSLDLAWWALGGPLTTPEGRDALVDLLAEQLPEALPNRWDTTELPRHHLADEGVDGLKDFLRGDRRLPLFWPRPPVHRLNVAWHSWGGSFQHFCTTALRLGIDASVMGRPEWRSRLPLVFEEIAQIMQPFYAEARISEAVDPQTDRKLYGFWGWVGVPTPPPLAMIVGPPYLSVWEVATTGRANGELRVFSSERWPEAPPRGLPNAPQAMVEQALARIRTSAWGELKWYPAQPPVWPFSEQRWFLTGDVPFAVRDPSQPD